MNVYLIHSCYDDNYLNHQMLKEIFPENGKLLYQRNGSSLLVLTNISIIEKFKGDFSIQKMGKLEDFFDRLGENNLFSLRLNAVKANRRKKFSLYDEEVDDWVTKKLENIGLEIINCINTREGVLRSKRKGDYCYHNSVLVNGVMKIRDIERFEEAVRNGVGKGKAFGFGLVNIFF